MTLPKETNKVLQIQLARNFAKRNRANFENLLNQKATTANETDTTYQNLS
jgi:hypothetical protein